VKLDFGPLKGGVHTLTAPALSELPTYISVKDHYEVDELLSPGMEWCTPAPAGMLDVINTSALNIAF
jgi:hypothetical protein